MAVINLIEQQVKDYIESKRPPIEVRKQLDIGYSYSDNVVEIYEIRPQWNDNTIIHNYSKAKAKYVKSKNEWNIYWFRETGKWSVYKPVPIVDNVSDFLTVIEEDSHGCFWG